MHFHTVHTAHDTAPEDHSQPQPTHPGRTPHALSHSAHCSRHSSTRPQPTTAYTPRQNTTSTFTQCTLLTTQLHKTTAYTPRQNTTCTFTQCTLLTTQLHKTTANHSQPQPSQPGRTPHAVEHDLILLMMGIMMPETC